MTWLERTPIAVFDAMVAMLPRLEAHESRSSATVVGVGHSFKPGSWAKRQLTEWGRSADAGRSAVKAPAARDLSAIGIKFTKEKRHGG